MEIFLSYRRQESEDFAGRLYDHLVEHFGDVVFRDVNTLGPGVRFDDTIRSTISGCKVLLAVVGRNWLGVRPDGTRRIDDPDDWARLEVERALEQNVQVIPVLSGDAAMPGPADLPASLRPFALRNAIRLDDAHWHEDVTRLVTAIDQFVGTRSRATAESYSTAPAPPASDLTSPPPAAGAGRPRVALTALALAVPLLLIASLVALSSGRGPDKRTVQRAVAVAPTTTAGPPTSEPVPTSIGPAPAGPGATGGSDVRPVPAPVARQSPDTSPPPAPSVTTAPVTSALPPPTTTTAPPPPPQSARFRISPLKGPVGTTIAISADACPRPSGWTGGEIYYGLADPNGAPGAPDPVTGTHAWAPDATWQGQLVVPPLAPGEYWVYANCYATNPATGTWSPAYEYPSTDFIVT